MVATRRCRLARHNLDPNLVDELDGEKNDHIRAAYIEKYGQRPHEAQSNSSPF